MIEYVPFHWRHAFQLEVQPAQQVDYDAFMRTERVPPIALTGVFGGRIIACAGIGRYDDTVIAWALLSKHVKDCSVALTRKIIRVLDAHPAPVVLTAVAHGEGIEQRQRWAEALGFHRTGRVREPDALYPVPIEVFERVKHGA